MIKYLYIVLLVFFWSCEDEASEISIDAFPSFFTTFHMFENIDTTGGVDAMIKDVLLTNDNNYLLSLMTEPMTGEGNDYILKIDNLGNIIWISDSINMYNSSLRNETYGYSVFCHDHIESQLIKYDFGGNIISTLTPSISGNIVKIIESNNLEHYIYTLEVMDNKTVRKIIKLDSELNIIDSSSDLSELFPASSIRTPFKSNNGFILIRRIFESTNFVNYLSEINHNADSILWTNKIEEDLGLGSVLNNSYDSFWYSKIQSTNGVYTNIMKKVNYSGAIDKVVEKGNAFSHANTSNDSGFVWIADGYIEKYNHLGNLIWSKDCSDLISRLNNGISSQTSFHISISEWNDGSYFLYGYTTDNDSGILVPFVAKTDIDGDIDFEN